MSQQGRKTDSKRLVDAWTVGAGKNKGRPMFPMRNGKRNAGVTGKTPVGIIEVLDVSLQTDSGEVSRSMEELRVSICLGNAMRMELLEHESNTLEKIYERN